MPDSIAELKLKRDQILQEIQSIDRLRRGSLSEQFFDRKRDGKKVRLGPYFVLQCFLKGTKCSERIQPDHAEQIRNEVANYQRFKDLADQFVEVTDRITRLESGSAESKKNSRHRKSAKSNLPSQPPS
jgi:transposase